jgi:hypothetical protein
MLFGANLLDDLRIYTSRIVGTGGEQSDVLTIQRCSFCDWLKKSILYFSLDAGLLRTCSQLSKEGNEAVPFICRYPKTP